MISTLFSCPPCGEGRPGLTGTDAAAPIMFDVFSQLPALTLWFKRPEQEMEKVLTCEKSGYRASSFCVDVDTTWITKPGLLTAPCSYHKIIHLTKDHKYQIHSSCADVHSIQNVNWFVLPPVQEYYYKSKNLSYKSVPPYRQDCQVTTAVLSMEMIYPKHNARVFIPRELDGQLGSAVFELVHRNANTVVFWHLDGKFIGTTKRAHHMALNPDAGKHTLILVDEFGEVIERHFQVMNM